MFGVITGSSSSGKACIAELLKLGVKASSIRAAYRTQEKANAGKKEFGSDLVGISGVDAFDAASLKNFFTTCDRALIVTPNDPTRGFADDAKLTCDMIKAAAESSVKYIVLVASWTVNQPEKVSQIASRFLPAEELLNEVTQKSGVKYSILRGSVFANNFDYFLNGDSFAFPPNVAIPIVDTKDIGKTAAHCLKKYDGSNDFVNKALEISGPRRETGESMVLAASKALQKDFKYIPVSQEDFTSKMPAPVAQLFNAVCENDSVVPLTSVVKDITGHHTTYEEYVREWKGRQ